MNFIRIYTLSHFVIREHTPKVENVQDWPDAYSIEECGFGFPHWKKLVGP